MVAANTNAPYFDAPAGSAIVPDFVNFNIPGSSSQLPSVTPPAVIPARPAAFTLGPVRLMADKWGRYVLVRVNSKKGHAVIRVQVRSKASKLLTAKTFTIRTNRSVRLSALKVPKKAKKVTVRVLRVR